MRLAYVTFGLFVGVQNNVRVSIVELAVVILGPAFHLR